MPPLPRNRIDVHEALEAIKCQTNKSEEFILLNDRISGIVVFCCETNIKYLSKQTTVYVDGTFSYCTKHFLQFFTIHTVENGHYIPLVFSLLPDKRSESYSLVFNTLRKKCEELSIALNPRKAVCDFEVAIHVALKKVWPDIQLIGCRFHLAQSWWRKIQEVGLAKDYRNKESDIAKWLGWTFGLPFLNPDEIGDCFVDDFMSVQPNTEKVRKYADYLVENYINEDNATFPPSMWASCTSSTERTTNACESFHARFNNNFYCPHPDIFKFIDVLKNFQIDTYVKIDSVHIPVKVKNVNYKKRNEYISNMIEMFQTGRISRFKFVKSVSYHYRNNVS